MNNEEIVSTGGESQLTDRLVAVSRVAKVVKGKTFRFNALVTVAMEMVRSGLVWVRQMM